MWQDGLNTSRSDIEHIALNDIQQRRTNSRLVEIPIMDDIARAMVKHLGDGISVDVWKKRKIKYVQRLYQLIITAGEVGYFPSERKNASIVTIYKKRD